jgi:hypothetical protein
MEEPSQPLPQKKFSKFKLALYLLALIGLVWLGLQAYWGFFKLKIWMSGFGTGAFWIIGLIVGFIYFHSAHRIHERIKEMPRGLKKIGSYAGFSLALVIVNPLVWSLGVWVFSPIGGTQTMCEWLFIGCAVATVIVLALERLFAKKKPPKQDNKHLEEHLSH